MSAVHLLTDGPVAELQLDNPDKLNALTIPMLESLEAHCARLELDEEIRAVMLTAQGNRAFCVGADIKTWSEIPPAKFARNWVRDGHRIFDRLAGLSKPTIAALNSHAFGGGLELATACDMRIMHPQALLAMPEAGVGIVPGWSGSQRLQRLLPEAAIKEMALFGRKISAQRAFELGFVAELAEDPIARAREIAAATLELSPRAVEVSKYLIHAGAGENSAALVEALGSGMMAASKDKAEGVAAFSAKRKPVFPGD